MRTAITWADRVHDRDGVKQCIYDMCFRPDGSQLIVASGQRVFVYDTADGDLIQSLKGHKNSVYCVSYAKDGKRFASGGADATVIIWNHKLEGILKYSHNETIQCLSYNPVTNQLASCTATDFGLWSPEQKSVAKHRVGSKVLCCSWTNDGQFLALGLLNGHVTIRDKDGGEKVRIERTAPVWCIAWNPSKDEPYDILAVGTWDQKLSFYQLSGRQVTKEKDLGFDPCSISYFSNGEYLCIGGSDKKVTLWTKEGVKLVTIGEREDWVWCCQAKPKHNYVAVGCNDGTLTLYQLVFNTVHGLYQDRYAYRDFMTDVIIQNLTTEQKLRIKCRDYVKKIAIYRERLAVQLPSMILIYELLPSPNAAASSASNTPSTEDLSTAGEVAFKARWKIQKKLDCNLLVVTSLHIILCQEKKLQLYDFKGDKVREWVLESLIRYIKVIGGPRGREGLLVGLKNGQVLKIFIDNQFPVPLVKHKSSVRCLDLSASRKRLAIVDESNLLSVYTVDDKALVYTEAGANSVAWNSELEDMLCFSSGNGVLNIKTGKFPVHQQKMQGFVVGFKGSRIFCLHVYAMQSIDVPQSASLYRHLDKKDYDNAYKIACLGVTDSDWRLLAHEALQGLSLDIARKAFIRTRDLRYIELIKNIENQRKLGVPDKMFLAEIAAYQGKYTEAAKLYTECGQVEKAIDMFTDLRRWEDAKKFAQAAERINIMDLIRGQAQWAEEARDWKAAAEMYRESGDIVKAVEIFGDRGWFDELMELCKSLAKTEYAALEKAAAYFRKGGNTKYASEIYLKMGDYKSLVAIYIEQQKWDAALKLIESHPDLTADVYLPYAHFLAINDRFEEAQVAFKKAGHPEEAVKVLESLTHNAIVENRFDDGGYYFWLLANEYLKMITHTSKSELTAQEQNWYQMYTKYSSYAEIYYAYSFVHKYTEEPFTTHPVENIFNICRFLLSAITKETPMGVSKLAVLFALGKTSRQLGAFKLARYAYDKLQQLRIPPSWSDQLDLAALSIRSKPFSDKDDLMPICYRCSFNNPLISSLGCVCSNCKHPFIYSFYSFDILPLVEFMLEGGISDEEATVLLQMAPKRSKKSTDNDGWRESQNGNVQSLSFEDESNRDDFDADPFLRLLDLYEQQEAGVDVPLKVNRDILRSLDKSEVFIVPRASPFEATRYYRNMAASLPVVMCLGCHHFFLEDDFEIAAINQKNLCPVCRAPANHTLGQANLLF